MAHRQCKINDTKSAKYSLLRISMPPFSKILLWNAKLTETRIFIELYIELKSSLIELNISLIQLESSLIQLLSSLYMHN